MCARNSELNSRRKSVWRRASSAAMYAAKAAVCGALLAGMVTPGVASEERGSRVLLAQASRPGGEGAQAQVDSLIKAAKAEGELTYYMVLPESTTKRINDAFEAKYGLRVQVVRLPSNPIMQRYAAEAEAGSFAADLMIIATTGDVFAEQAIQKGWMEPVSQAGIPAITSGDFPKKFLPGQTAIIQITPWAFAYNTDKVKAAEAPREWIDLANPRWKGQFLIPNARTADSYLDLWTVLADRHGGSYFAQLRAQDIRAGYNSGTALMQGLGAGEGAVAGPTTMGLVLTLKSKGGPIEGVIPDFTTGLQQHIMLTSRSKAKHPNAGRLFVHYVLSRDGNKVLNDEPGSVGVYDSVSLPKQYQVPGKGATARREEVMKLLGIP